MKQHATTLLIAILAVAGCNSQDERLSRLVRDTTAEQANQNRAVTDLNREAVDSHRAVVEAVEQSRQELVLLERDLHQQRDRIDDERADLATERYRESLLGPVLVNVGATLVAALPLVLCWYLLHGISQHDETAASETLIREFVADHPLLRDQASRQTLVHQDGHAETEEPPF